MSRIKNTSEEAIKNDSEAKTLDIYNLEFPLGVKEFDLRGYEFHRHDDYESRRQSLQQLVNVVDEHEIKKNTGTHVVTGYVECPDNEEDSILFSDYTDTSRLNDILFFLSIFTNRHVFAVKPGLEDPIIADPRIPNYGGGLICSLENVFEYYDESTGKVVPQEDVRKIELSIETRDLSEINGVEKILELIETEKWGDLYKDGFYLRLYSNAIQRSDRKINFILSATVWEHLYALNKLSTMTERAIQQESFFNKLKFILEHYFKFSLSKKSEKNIKKWSRARNRVVHFGKLPHHVTETDIDLFIRTTEALIAFTLDLTPSNVFNYQDRLKTFLEV